MKADVNADAFLTCSALENVNIKAVFEKAARLALAQKSSKDSKGCCTIIWSHNKAILNNNILWCYTKLLNTEKW